MIASFCIVFKIGIQEIGKEEYFKDYKHHKKLDNDDQPCLFSPTWHLGKSLGVKSEYPFYYFHFKILNR